MDPATVFAEWTLGRIPGERLSLIASALLADGFETPNLRALGETPSGELNGKGRELLVAAMSELGIAQPTDGCDNSAEMLSDFFFLLEEWETVASGELGTLAQAEASIREAAARLLEDDRLAESSSGKS